MPTFTGPVGKPSGLQRLLLLTQQGLCLAELIHGADHRVHDAHVAIGSRAENGAQLRPEDLRMAERHADGAEAEEGIVLMRQLERRQLLVAADIQRADDERACPPLSGAAVR